MNSCKHCSTRGSAAAQIELVRFRGQAPLREVIAFVLQSRRTNPGRVACHLLIQLGTPIGTYAFPIGRHGFPLGGP